MDGEFIQARPVSNIRLLRSLMRLAAVDVVFAPDYLCLPWMSHLWLNCDDLDADDLVPADVGLPLPDEKQHSTPANTDADSNSMNSDDNSVSSVDVSIVHEQSSFVHDNGDSKMDLSDHNNQNDVRVRQQKIETLIA